MTRLAIDDSAVTLSLDPAARGRLRWHCDTCDVPCTHAGAAFSLILEDSSLDQLAWSLAALLDRGTHRLDA